MSSITNATVEDLAMDGAACRLFRDAPSWEARRTAAVGGFHCDSAEQGAALLSRAMQMLRAEGFAAIIGPMDGDTWHRYRLVAESDNSPPFLMEPVSGPHDLAAFSAAGFSPISQYVSTRTSLDQAIEPNEVAAPDGVSVTAWDGRDAAGLIGRLFDMSTASFSRNAFFKPIGKADFFKLYEPILPAIEPRFVLFAHDPAGALTGFLFGLPNRAEGHAPHSAILKTYASGRRGVGRLLADRFHRTARELGFRDAIHALMHVDNVSLERSGRHAGRVFRRYALMGRPL
jgi:hypothetical protein